MFDAYTVKKMLPRLLIAIILVNLSWDICRILIDYINIIGQSVGGLIAGFAPGESAAFDDIGAGLQGLAVGGAAAWVLATSGGILISLMMLIALSLFVGFLALSLRQVVILVLVVLSPVMLVLWVFPGMDKWAKRWFDLFTKALFMYPFMMAMIASGSLVSSLINNQPGSQVNAAQEITAVAVKFIPFFLLPFAMKLAGGTLANVAGMVNDKSRGLLDLQRKRNSAKVGENWNAMRMGRRFDGDRAPQNFLNKAGLLVSRPTYALGRFKGLPMGVGQKARGEVALARDREKYEAQKELYDMGVRDHDTANELMIHGGSSGKIRARAAAIRTQAAELRAAGDTTKADMKEQTAQRLERVSHMSGDRYRLAGMEIAAGFGKVDDRALRALDDIYTKPSQDGEKMAALQSIREASKAKGNFVSYAAKMSYDADGKSFIETYTNSEEAVAGGASVVNEGRADALSLYLQDAGPGILGQTKQYDMLDSKGNKVVDSKSAHAAAVVRGAVDDLLLGQPNGSKGKTIDARTGQVLDAPMSQDEINARRGRALEVIAQLKQPGAYTDLNTKTAVDRAYSSYIAGTPLETEYKRVEQEMLLRGRPAIPGDDGGFADPGAPPVGPRSPRTSPRPPVDPTERTRSNATEEDGTSFS